MRACSTRSSFSLALMPTSLFRRSGRGGLFSTTTTDETKALNLLVHWGFSEEASVRMLAPTNRPFQGLDSKALGIAHAKIGDIGVPLSPAAATATFTPTSDSLRIVNTQSSNIKFKHMDLCGSAATHRFLLVDCNNLIFRSHFAHSARPLSPV